ncbi:MAG TPA: arabinofuranosidase catalytic domain-containing protein [Polyangiaceae bacterium]|nr:arabinofuranosidase catalytic domain-containing protein [Polyangiaceae bacterium]
MKLGPVAAAIAAVCELALIACGSSSVVSSGTAGSPGSGGRIGQGGALSNGGSAGKADPGGANVMPCGGSVVGTWKVISSSLVVSGTLDLSAIGAGCPSAAVTGSLTATGTFAANANGTYSDETSTSGEERFDLAPSCLVISSTQTDCAGAANVISALGYATVACTPVSAGGCTCSATIKQAGGPGLVSVFATPNGNYVTSGSQLTLDAEMPYAYCVSGNTMTWTPKPVSPTESGTIVFEKVEAAGGGGTGGGAGGMAGSSGGQGGSGGIPSAGGSGGKPSMSPLQPCDIYKAGGNPCVAAHSTVRALFQSYDGKLYQVRNAAGATKDILTLAPGGIADGVAQDAFCAGTTCVVTVVYDQSGKGNDLWYQGSTKVPGSPQSSPAKATSESLTVGGHKVYSLYINPGNSYWVDASKSGIALGKEPEAMYMVTNSKHYNSGCCFDYGNSETDRKADGSGAMDALNFSSTTAWGSGAGSGPWIMADLEYGLFAQGDSKKNANNPSQTATFVTAMLKNNGTTEFALRGGDATSGKLSTYYKGALPGGWNPMKKQGAIVLGSGGDCCKPDGGANQSDGTFYEGCIVTGYPSDATEDSVQAAIIAAGYVK